MYKYAIWVRINSLQTANTFIWANNDYEAKMLAESQYGTGNVLNYTRVSE
jgi:ethanolamine utilization microcompartment shell protein EutL